MADRPAFAKDERVWQMTLAVLEKNGQLDLTGEPSNWPAANNIYQRLLRRHSPALAEAERRERLLAHDRERSLKVHVLSYLTDHKRETIIDLDIGGWYVTRAGLFAHTAELTEQLVFHPEFARSTGEENYAQIQVRPLFHWWVHVTSAPEAGDHSYRITHDVARWLVRNAPAEVGEWMVKELRGGILALGEAILDVEHELPTIGGVDVHHSTLDHRATKDLIRQAIAEIETAILAIQNRR